MIKSLQSNGCEVIKTHGSGLRSGEPDLIGVVAPWGFHVAIEVKKPGERPTLQQRVRLLQYARRGSIAFAADNVEAAVLTVLTEARRRERCLNSNIPYNAVAFTESNLL
jgi:Holliday junction resolvase